MKEARNQRRNDAQGTCHFKVGMQSMGDRRIPTAEDEHPTMSFLDTTLARHDRRTVRGDLRQDSSFIKQQ